mmetsp:Transcript_14786/g.37569  ORF Transcript_14786/g.37569 Transcript_14786/m.37569 type:complete len:286 (-) Transcript_14786:466-1323(-)
MLGHGRRCRQFGTVEFVAAPLHNAVVHAVLDGQHLADALPIHFLQALEQRAPQPPALRLLADDCWWELQVVPCQHDALGLEDGRPRGDLQRLRCFIDHRQIEALLPQILGVDPRQSATHDLGCCGAPRQRTHRHSIRGVGCQRSKGVARGGLPASCSRPRTPLLSAAAAPPSRAGAAPASGLCGSAHGSDSLAHGGRALLGTRVRGCLRVAAPSLLVVLAAQLHHGLGRFLDVLPALARQRAIVAAQDLGFQAGAQHLQRGTGGNGQQAYSRQAGGRGCARGEPC